MAQVLVRNIEDDVIQQLKNLAHAHGRSLEAEIRKILQQFANNTNLDHQHAVEQITELRQSLKGRKFPDSAALIREDRER